MNKFVFSIFIFLILLSTSHAFERSFTYLKQPSLYEVGEFRVGVLHRFFGDFSTTKSLGMYDGANFSLDGSISISDQRRVSFFFSNQDAEFDIGVNQYLFEYWNIYNSFQVDYFLYEFNNNNYSGFMIMYLMQYQNPNGKFFPIFNYYYNTDTEISNVAFGLEYILYNNVFFQYEYIVSNQSSYDDSTSVYGIKFSTLGLNFYLTFQNTTETGFHSALNGVQSNGNTYMGIKIDRMFDLKDFRRKTEYRQDYDRYMREAQQ